MAAGGFVKGVSNAAEVAARIAALPPVVAVRVAGVVHTYGMLLESDVKRRASRPRTEPSEPGLPPRLQTGNYVRSIGTRFDHSGIEYTALVGTNAPQGRRLEFGFNGIDAAGRHSRTYPHPHWRPAMKQVGAPFRAAVAAVVGSAQRSAGR